MRARVLITLLLLAFLTALAPAQGQNVTWMVTE